VPTVQQILDEVTDVKYPGATAFTDANLISFGNECLRKIWRFMNEDGIYRFNLIADQETYGLPTDGLAYDKIDAMDIADDTSKETYTTYKWRGLLEDSISHYFYKVTPTTFGLYPAPAESITDGGVIYYGSRFTLMSVSDLTATPAVNEDYHSLIADYICMKAASSGNNPDIESRNNFATDYNDGWKRLMFERVNAKCKCPKKPRKNKWW